MRRLRRDLSLKSSSRKEFSPVSSTANDPPLDLVAPQLDLDEDTDLDLYTLYRSPQRTRIPLLPSSHLILSRRPSSFSSSIYLRLARSPFCFIAFMTLGLFLFYFLLRPSRIDDDFIPCFSQCSFDQRVGSAPESMDDATRRGLELPRSNLAGTQTLTLIHQIHRSFLLV